MIIQRSLLIIHLFRKILELTMTTTLKSFQFPNISGMYKSSCNRCKILGFDIFRPTDADVEKYF